MDRRKEGKGVLASYFLAFVKTSSTARKLSSARGGYFESSPKPRWLSVETNIRKVFASGGGGCICRALSSYISPRMSGEFFDGVREDIFIFFFLGVRRFIFLSHSGPICGSVSVHSDG